MKLQAIKTVFILFTIASLSFTTKNTLTTTAIKVVATYQGFDEDGYTFTFVNDDEDEEVVTFVSVSDALLKKYDLKDVKFIDQEFEITYDYHVSEDEIETPVLQSIKIIE